MNLFAIIILAALVLDFSLNLAGDLLNLKALGARLPPALRDIYQPEDYRRSQEYLRVKTRFGLIDSGFGLAVLLVFWFSGGFDWLDRLIRAWGFIPLVNGLLYIGILVLAYELLTLPLSIYDTFVIEERFGFNRTTPGTFILDRIKGLGLAVVLGGPLLAGVLALFQYAGAFAWLYVWAAVVAFSLVMQYAAPAWIMPLFNKFSPMPPGELKQAILGYARRVAFPVKSVFVMDSSKRSGKSNAFFTGFGRYKRIVLFDTLIGQHSVGEIVAVIAHEVGHYKKKHVLQGTVIGILHTGVIFYLLSLLLGSPGLYEAFYVQQPSVYTGLLFFGLLYTPLELVISIATQAVSRKHEYDADRFAAETIDEPESLVSSLKTLSSTNLANLTPHPFHVFLSYSHPPLMQRIEAIRSLKTTA